MGSDQKFLYRFQRQRIRGWRKPSGGVIVDRTTPFGNAHNHEELGRPEAGRRFLRDLVSGHFERAFYKWEGWPRSFADIRGTLGGHSLGCPCPPGEPCHADLLLTIANDERIEEPGLCCDACLRSHALRWLVPDAVWKHYIPPEYRHWLLCFACWKAITTDRDNRAFEAKHGRPYGWPYWYPLEWETGEAMPFERWAVHWPAGYPESFEDGARRAAEPAALQSNTSNDLTSPGAGA
jgi:hypothetical protein